MPVLNQTGDPTLDYIASGLTSEISGAISKISTLNVISDSSVNVTFSDNATIEQVSQELSLDHLLFGNLSYNGDGIEISIHLYETAENSKEVIYTNLGALNEVLESRSNIFNAIRNTIDVPISKIERINATRLGTTNFEAYEEFLKGDYNFKLRTQEGTFAAKNHFENAIRIDPNFARPYGYLALVFNRIASPNSAISLTAQERQNTIYVADFISLAATSIGSNVPQAYFARAFVETFNLGMHEAALKNSDTAISINPNYADALGLRASILNTLEKPEQALENLKKAKKLNPNFAVEYLEIEAISYMLLGQWEAAKRFSNLALERLPESIGARINLICADMFLGNIEDALWNRDELLIYAPNFEVRKVIFGGNKIMQLLAIDCFAKLEKYTE